MGSIAGVKDEVGVDCETRIGQYRFQKYLKKKVVHIHNPEDEKVEYSIRDFMAASDKFLIRLRDLIAGETIRLRDLSISMLANGKIELSMMNCKDQIARHEFEKKMKEFIKLLERK